MNKFREQLKKWKFKDIGGYCYKFEKDIIKPETNEKIKIGANIDFWKDYIVLNFYEVLPNGRKAIDRMFVNKKPNAIKENLIIFLEKWNILV